MFDTSYYLKKKTENRLDLPAYHPPNSRSDDVHQQLRALTLLDLLIQNAGDDFLRNLSDHQLMAAVRDCATHSQSDRRVRLKCRVLLPQWELTARNVPQMQSLVVVARETAAHYRKIADADDMHTRPGTKSHSKSHSEEQQHQQRQRQRPQEGGSRSAAHTPGGGSRDKRRSRTSSHHSEFNFKKEEKNIRDSIASSNIASDNLMNALRLANSNSNNHASQNNVRDNPEVARRFRECRSLRRQVVRYIQNVTSEQYLGSLLKANENLVQAMENYDLLQKSVDYDTDSEEEDEDVDDEGGDDYHSGYADAEAGPPPPVPPKRPPRPDYAAKPVAQRHAELESASESEEDDDDDDDNPFGDRNAVVSPPSFDRERR